MTQHVAVYLRVSSKSQDHRSQEPDIESWTRANADETSVRVYRDSASGKSMDRPAWHRLEAAIDAGQVSTLVVWRLDRLGRTASGLVTLFEKLTEKRINFVSIKDGIDLRTPAGRLVAGVLSSVAQYELEVKTERQMAGIAAAKAAGKRWGGSEKGRRLKVTAEAEDTIRRMHADGASKAAMARATGLSRPTVYSVLRTAES